MSAIVNHLRELLVAGDYKSVLKEVEGLDKEDYPLGLIYKSKALELLGKYEETIKTAEKAVDLSKESSNPVILIASNVMKSIGIWKLGNLSEAMRLVDFAEELLEKTNTDSDELIQEWAGVLFNVKGVYFDNHGNINTALKYYFKSRDIREKLRS
jgi:tetratricopeptide (TPR) repeat protein